WLIVVLLSAAERDRAEVLGERAERRDRQEQEGADDHDRPDEETRERAGVVAQGAEAEWRGLLRAEARRHRDGRDDGNESGYGDEEPGGDVEGDGGRRGRRIGGEPEGYAEPVEGRAVVRRRRGELVQDLRHPVGPGIAHRVQPPARRREETRRPQDH